MSSTLVGAMGTTLVAAAVGAGDLALLFAKRAQAVAQESGVAHWLIASTAEGVARAYAASGNAHEFHNWQALAQRLVGHGIAAVFDHDDFAVQLLEPGQGFGKHLGLDLGG